MPRAGAAPVVGPWHTMRLLGLLPDEGGFGTTYVSTTIPCSTPPGRPELLDATEVVCAYCADPAIFSGQLRQTGLPKVGSIRSKFLLQSVQQLRRRLREELGSDLLVAAEAPQIWLPKLAAGSCRCAESTVLVCQGVTSEEMNSEGLVEEALAADFPMVFAPFGRAVRGNFRATEAPSGRGAPLRPELPEPKALPVVPEALRRRHGEAAGLRRLSEFLDLDLARYKETRNALVGLRQMEGDFLIFLSLKVGTDLFKLEGPGRVAQPWLRDPVLEKRLFEGRIGIPLIDAAIRDLAEYVHCPWTANGIDIDAYPWPPETASKRTLEGSAASDVAPEWYATTRNGKIESKGKGKQKGGKGRVLLAGWWLDGGWMVNGAWPWQPGMVRQKDAFTYLQAGSKCKALETAQYADLKQMNEHGQSLMFAAAGRRMKDKASAELLCQILQKRGLKVNTLDNHHQTPLFAAAQEGNEICADWLIAQGCEARSEAPLETMKSPKKRKRGQAEEQPLWKRFRGDLSLRCKGPNMMAQWAYQEEVVPEPTIPEKSQETLAENDNFMIIVPPPEAAARIRVLQREFALDHAVTVFEDTPCTLLWHRTTGQNFVGSL
eukprot:s2433_g6.t1